jgi:beta-galactosidase
MYKNGNFVKEYKPEDNSAFRHLKHSPLLIDDFVGEAIAENEKFKPRQARLVKEIVNYIAKNGYGSLPLGILWKAAQCMLLYGMKYNDIVDMYTKYAGDWGGSSTVYRFDGVFDGEVKRSVTKAPMTKRELRVKLYSEYLYEAETYDVGALRISAVDENGNLLHYCSEPIKVSTEGPIEIIGADTVALRGGMTGVYVRTVGKRGRAAVILTSPTFDEVRVELTVR